MIPHSKVDNADVGRIHALGASSLKATCNLAQHGGSCVCIVSVPTPGSKREAELGGDWITQRHIERDLAAWLDEGLDAASQAVHQEAARRLKADKYRMRVRGNR